jgi:hypothetical protein
LFIINHTSHGFSLSSTSRLLRLRVICYSFANCRVACLVLAYDSSTRRTVIHIDCLMNVLTTKCLIFRVICSCQFIDKLKFKTLRKRPPPAIQYTAGHLRKLFCENNVPKRRQMISFASNVGFVVFFYVNNFNGSHGTKSKTGFTASLADKNHRQPMMPHDLAPDCRSFYSAHHRKMVCYCFKSIKFVPPILSRQLMSPSLRFYGIYKCPRPSQNGSFHLLMENQTSISG